MVDRRLLTALVAIALASASGCVGVHVGRVAGRVVDAETGQGVAGVELFRTYPLTQVQVIGEVAGRNSFTPDWTTTGPGGEFEFPSRWVSQTGRIDHSPLLRWIHKDYGWNFVDTEKLEKSDLAIRLSREEARIEYLRGTRDRAGIPPCDGLKSHGAYRHCKEVVDALRGRR